ncbi:MAG: hypothetical protein ABL866_14260 [Devosia sp.]
MTISSESGFTQMVVLVGLAAVAGMLTIATATSFESSQSAGLLADRLSNETAAASALHRLMSAMASTGDDLEVRALGTPGLMLDVVGTPVLLTIEGEGGKINPATTANEIVEIYLKGLGLPPAELAMLRSRLDHLRATHATDALSAIYPDLLTVRSAEELDRDLTSFATRSGIDLRYASERALEAIPDLDAAEIGTILAERASNPAIVNGMSSYADSGSSRFSLVAEIERPDLSGMTRRVPIEITASGSVVLLGRAP